VVEAEELLVFISSKCRCRAPPSVDPRLFLLDDDAAGAATGIGTDGDHGAHIIHTGGYPQGPPKPSCAHTRGRCWRTRRAPPLLSLTNRTPRPGWVCARGVWT
jgi:hypothetical protein